MHEIETKNHLKLKVRILCLVYTWIEKPTKNKSWTQHVYVYLNMHINQKNKSKVVHSRISLYLKFKQF